MRSILGQRPLRYVFAANVISMLGSGMNAAAVAWYILQATHSEMALGTFAVLQTLPAMLMLPFTGVIIDQKIDAAWSCGWMLYAPSSSWRSPSLPFEAMSKSGSFI